MVSKVERFWIAFILRFAIGFFFLFAALGQFEAGPSSFADQLSAPFQSTWLGAVEVPVGEGKTFTGVDFAWYFLYGLPFTFTALAVFILTGLLLRPALRLGAILLVLLGLGKYLMGDIAYTANDFLFALIICIGLFFLSLEKRPAPASA